MKLHRVVIFGAHGARTKWTEDPRPYEGDPNALIDPILPPDLAGVPPHEWTIKNGKIEVRNTAIDTTPYRLQPRWLRPLLYLGFGFALGVLTKWLM